MLIIIISVVTLLSILLHLVFINKPETHELTKSDILELSRNGFFDQEFFNKN